MTLDELAATIQAAEVIAVATHRGPDPDGLGAALAFLHAGRRAGKRVVSLLAEPVPARWAWVDPDGLLAPQTHGDPTGAPPDDIALGLVFDAHTAARAGAPTEALGARGVPVVCVDHHVTGPDALPGIVATDRNATAEVVLDLLDALGWPLDAVVGTPLYAALAFDTGSFRHVRNDPSTFRRAARLLEAGVDAGPINSALFAERSAAETHLLAVLLQRIELHDDGRVALLSVPPALLAEHGVDPEAAAVATPHVLGIAGVQAAGILRPTETDGVWSWSLRARRGVDVRSLATAHGGGGHTLAAGAEVRGPFDAVRQLLLEGLTAAVARARG